MAWRKSNKGALIVVRWFFVISVTALLAACGQANEANFAEKAESAWTAEQRQAFQQFKNNSTQRAAVADTVARSFPAAFNYDELRARPASATSISQERLVELLGRPSISFSWVDRPEYLGANGRQLDFDPRELQVLLYDIDCLAENVAADCAHLEAITLRQNVLRVRVLRSRREDALTLLSQPPEPPV